MAKPPSETLPEPSLKPAAARAKAEREARQAAALRANLRRRKAQARGRDDTPAPPAGEPQGGGPGEAPRGARQLLSRPPLPLGCGWAKGRPMAVTPGMIEPATPRPLNPIGYGGPKARP